jgi:predicted small secreted protein
MKPLQPILAVALAAVALAGCETTRWIGKKIDYKSTSTTLPPIQATGRRNDDRHNVSTVGTRRAGCDVRPDCTNQIADAKIVKAGNERWLQAKSTPGGMEHHA